MANYAVEYSKKIDVHCTLHYYFLENSIQKMYRQYEELKCKVR